MIDPQRYPLLARIGVSSDLRTLDEAALLAEAGRLAAQVDAFAVTGHFAVRNPAHERRAARLLAGPRNRPSRRSASCRSASLLGWDGSSFSGRLLISVGLTTGKSSSGDHSFNQQSLQLPSP